MARGDESSSGKPVSDSRRVLLKAGWVSPVVIALSLPTSSYAQNSSGGGGGRPPWVPGPPPRTGRP